MRPGQVSVFAFAVGAVVVACKAFPAQDPAVLPPTAHELSGPHQPLDPLAFDVPFARGGGAELADAGGGGEGTPTSGGATAEARAAACPADMIEVRGTYCSREEYKCLHEMSLGSDLRPEASEGGVPYHCDRFEPGRVRCIGTEKSMNFCIDKYESQATKGELPERFVSYDEAAKRCGDRGKRLCFDDEWTLSCEGPERRPYPYGWRRDNEACNVSRCYDQTGVVGKTVQVMAGPESNSEYEVVTPADSPLGKAILGKKRGEVIRVPYWRNNASCAITEIRYIDPIPRFPDAVSDRTLARLECQKVTCAPYNEKTFAGIEVDPVRLPAELERLDQLSTGRARKAAGELPLCVSGYGVHDMTGNVDEWVTCRGNCEKYPSYLKGGHYLGLVRNRCHPTTTHHGPMFKHYAVGYRCCADAKSP